MASLMRAAWQPSPRHDHDNDMDAHNVSGARRPPDEAFVAALPKPELHLHLEGTITPRTWLELIRRHDRTAIVTLEDLRRRYAFPDMRGFFDVWMDVLAELRSPDDYRFIARECGRYLATQNVVYAELHTSIAGGVWSGRLSADGIVPAIADGLNEARAAGGPEWRLIVDAIRETVAADAGHIALDIARRNRDHGVVALGLGGNEERYATGEAAGVFAAAKAEGFRLTAHAGEWAGPESVRQALDIGADRIGHAVTAAQDRPLLEEIRARGIHLELCPTSNVRTGAIPALEAHPAGMYIRRGLRVSLNTDDPALFGTNLNSEYLRVAQAFGLSRDDVVRLARNAFEAAFLEPSERDMLLCRFDSATRSLTDAGRDQT
jgi:adenosine deaminase/aminodeoxyfutalosine deaminase